MLNSLIFGSAVANALATSHHEDACAETSIEPVAMLQTRNRDALSSSDTSEDSSPNHNAMLIEVLKIAKDHQETGEMSASVQTILGKMDKYCDNLMGDITKAHNTDVSSMDQAVQRLNTCYDDFTGTDWPVVANEAGTLTSNLKTHKVCRESEFTKRPTARTAGTTWQSHNTACSNAKKGKTQTQQWDIEDNNDDCKGAYDGRRTFMQAKNAYKDQIIQCKKYQLAAETKACGVHNLALAHCDKLAECHGEHSVTLQSELTALPDKVNNRRDEALTVKILKCLVDELLTAANGGTTVASGKITTCTTQTLPTTDLLIREAPSDKVDCKVDKTCEYRKRKTKPQCGVGTYAFPLSPTTADNDPFLQTNYIAVSAATKNKDWYLSATNDLTQYMEASPPGITVVHPCSNWCVKMCKDSRVSGKPEEFVMEDPDSTDTFTFAQTASCGLTVKHTSSHSDWCNDQEGSGNVEGVQGTVTLNFQCSGGGRKKIHIGSFFNGVLKFTSLDGKSAGIDKKWTCKAKA